MPMNSETDPGEDRPTSHDAAGLEFETGEDREYWWALLSAAMKARITDFAGPVLDWWAYTYADSDRRPYAVVFGERGLVVTTPTLNEAGGPSHRLDLWTFVPTSIRDVEIAHQASRTADSMPRRGTSVAPLQDELNPQMRGFLGNLPIEAQQSLQQPFLTRDSLMSSGFHYYGSDAELDARCYLAGRNSVTFARGRKTVDLNQVTWQLTCWRADVKRA
jgi:hypothetical protein